LFPGYKGPWSVSFISFIVRSTSVHIPIWESCNPKIFLLIVYKNITKNNNLLSSTPRLSGFELTTLVVMCTDCIGSYKSNYHTIMTARIFNNIYFFFKKERKIRVIFFLCKGCDILVFIFLFWIAIKLKTR
jgi:hypothetical protein